jgi:hypothetical protein
MRRYPGYVFSSDYQDILLTLRAFHQSRNVWAIAPILYLVLTIGFGSTAGSASQQNFPAPPADRMLIYWQAEKDAPLAALPVESATTTLRPDVPAGSDKMGRVELKGESAQTVITSGEPHFFLFVPDTPGVHPPLLVRLTPRRGSRRASAMAQRGQRGFAIISEEIVKPRYRVLRREGGTIYMEVWGRQPLESGEYAFIGSDLARIPTFRVVETLNR